MKRRCKEEKINFIKDFRSISSSKITWTTISPNDDADWISHRNDSFNLFIPLGDKDDKSNKATVFLPIYSNGLNRIALHSPLYLPRLTMRKIQVSSHPPSVIHWRSKMRVRKQRSISLLTKECFQSYIWNVHSNWKLNG